MIVAPAFVIALHGLRMVTFRNESFFRKALQRAVERSRSKSDLPLRLGFNLSHDSVPVQILVCECKKYLEGRIWKWMKFLFGHLAFSSR